MMTGQFLERIAKAGINSFELLTYLANGTDEEGVVHGFTKAKEIYADMNELSYSGVQRHIVKLEELGLLKKVTRDAYLVDGEFLKIMVKSRLFQYCGKCKRNTAHDDDVKRQVVICIECGHEKKYKVRVNDKTSI